MAWGLFRYNLTFVLFFAALLLPRVAWAGPPFLTDDPEPADYEHWEIYTFSQAIHSKGSTSGTAPSVEANYGAFPGVHLHILTPLAFDKTDGESSHYGFGDLEVGAKVRFLNSEENPLGLSLATFPVVDFPSGDSDRGLGAGHTRFFVPLWLQKSFGNWTTYGGGGYWNNPGSDNKNYWFFGWELQRKLTDDLLLGAEVFHQTKDQSDGSDSTGFNIGCIYDLTENHHLLFSAGRGIQHVSATNEFSYYIGYQLTF